MIESAHNRLIKDIKALAMYFVETFNKDYKLSKTISDEAIEVLQQYSWPGNIRELENIMERIMISFDGQEITRNQVEQMTGIAADRDRDIESFEGKSMTELLEDYERLILEEMMSKYKRASEVGRKLKMNKSTLSRRLSKYGIE